MDELVRCGLKPGEETLSSANKTDVEASTSVSCSDGDSVVEKAESEASSTSEELQVFNDNSSFVQKETTSSKRGTLPPRAPVSSDPRLLPSQPSIVRRMMDANKHYVDPKDARTLLPGVLLRSGSLDLEGAIEDGQTKQTEDVKFNEKLQEEALLRILQAQELERINENLMYNQHQQDPLLAAANLELLANVLNESCGVAPGGNLLQTTPLQTNSNALLQQMMPRSRHMRSLSEPTFAFPEIPQAFSPFNQSFHGAPPTPSGPILDPNAETLALLGLTGSRGGGNFQQSNWPTQQQQAAQNLIPNDHASAMMADLLTQQQDLKNRRKTVGSRSVDFTALKQTKRNGVSLKDKSPPSNPVPNGGGGGPAPKNPTKAEVKKLVEKQTSMGRPMYAPWFRDRLGQPMKTNTKDDLQIGQNSPSPRHHPQGPIPGHNRSVSTPGIAFNIDENEVRLPPPPPPGIRLTPNQGTKPKGAGTGVFLPRLPT